MTRKSNNNADGRIYIGTRRLSLFLWLRAVYRR